MHPNHAYAYIDVKQYTLPFVSHMDSKKESNISFWDLKISKEEPLLGMDTSK
jgi:hypothetical protein